LKYSEVYLFVVFKAELCRKGAANPDSGPVGFSILFVDRLRASVCWFSKRSFAGRAEPILILIPLDFLFNLWIG
ncbi:hypothetical protein, partial [Sediminicola sp. 1XM1-17]|uniref:hypothetical protein n=1 Tax=Sediminicola sp. 1XM1-17 TaxID=3127702 RepID=UPI0030769B37